MYFYILYIYLFRWLDDVGLPQYKDAFMEARVDGRVLNYLTIDDLFQLKVNFINYKLIFIYCIQFQRIVIYRTREGVLYRNNSIDKVESQNFLDPVLAKP